MVTLITLTVLAAAVAAIAVSVSTSANVSLQGASWQEALMAAEAGADSAMASFRVALDETQYWTNANNALSDNQAGSTAWTGWTTDGNNPPLKLSYTPDSSHTLTLFRSATTGTTGMQAAVTIEAPSGWTAPVGQWYRVRSTGVSGTSGTPRSGADKRDSDLRKISLKNMRAALSGFPTTSLSGNVSQVSRSVELIVKPISTSLFNHALLAASSVNMATSVVVDSFDSSDSTKSTNGQYDASKQQSHGDVASNDIGAKVKIGHANIYGNLSFDTGTAVYPENVHGTISNNFYQQIVDISAPSWSSYNATPTTINKVSYTFNGGPEGNPGRYRLSAISLQGGNVLTFQNAGDSANKYIEIWVIGDVTMSSDNTFVVPAGYNVTMYIGGKVQITGSSFVNQTNTASALTLYGIKPSDSSNPSWKVTSDGSFVGTFYAPEADFTLSGTGTFYGAAVVHTISFGNGGTSFHYDEALAKDGPGGTLSYQVASWTEDIR